MATRAPSAATSTCSRRSTPTRARAGWARSASARTFGIDRPIGAILFDEKIGGTVHLAVGRSYPETGGANESAVHWDMICDLRGGGRLSADGEVDPAERRLRRLTATVPRAMRRTKIVATIGPASRDPEVLVRMVEAGMDVARLNFSHGSAEEHAETAQARARRRQPRRPPGRDPAGPAGPEAADRQARDDIAELKPGDEVTFVCGEHDASGATPGGCTSPGPASPTRSSPTRSSTSPTAPCGCASTRPAAGDGEIDASVEIGGSVASRQGLNIPGETAALPSVPEEDLRHLETGEKIGVDLVALSFVRRAEDIEAVRKHTRLPLIAKIEKPQAVSARRRSCAPPTA